LRVQALTSGPRPDNQYHQNVEADERGAIEKTEPRPKSVALSLT